MSSLKDKQCLPCKGGAAPLKGELIAPLLEQLGGGWKVINGHHLEKEYRFDNFVDALDFVNKTGAIAEEQAHHPDIFLAWGKVKITLFTHKLNGLTESDFILAAKIDG
jgi:4a-hydroxytetrahydrobiopterin dehydratase